MGLKVVELAGIGPGPFAAMLLADLGAEVIKIDRQEEYELGIKRQAKFDLTHRSRSSVAIDLKHPQGAETVLRLVESADVLIEGYRPGVTEKLGLGPDTCLERNPRLVYARMTGFGGHGPLSKSAGHDINYIALSGALHAIGGRDKPMVPLNLVGDYGGGSLYLAFGVMSAIYEAQRSGRGQVVDVGIVDGATSLMTEIYGFQRAGFFTDEREANLLDGGAPFYNVYECADEGKFVSIGAIEPKFYALLLEKLGLAGDDTLPVQMDRKRWPELRARFDAVFRSKTRSEWLEHLEGSDVCFSPVLSMSEAHTHHHNIERGNFVEVEGVVQPAPCPKFSRTPGKIHSPPPAQAGAHTESTLRDWGFGEEEVKALKDSRAVGRKE